MLDRSRAHPQPDKLPPGDDAVLLLREPRELAVPFVSGARFSPYSGVK